MMRPPPFICYNEPFFSNHYGSKVQWKQWNIPIDCKKACNQVMANCSVKGTVHFLFFPPSNSAWEDLTLFPDCFSLSVQDLVLSMYVEEV